MEAVPIQTLADAFHVHMLTLQNDKSQPTYSKGTQAAQLRAFQRRIEALLPPEQQVHFRAACGEHYA